MSNSMNDMYLTPNEEDRPTIEVTMRVSPKDYVRIVDAVAPLGPAYYGAKKLTIVMCQWMPPGKFAITDDALNTIEIGVC